MDEKSANFIGQVMELFLRNGIKSMTMDDISRNMGISKKTLYKYVSDKGDLVVKTIESGRDQDEKVIQEIQNKATNAIDENYEIYQYVSSKLSNIHPSIFYDIQKYYPKAWEVFSAHKENFISQCVEKNLIRGIKEGLYRDDLNVQVIRDLHLVHMDYMFDGIYPSLKEQSFSKVYLESFRYHIRGIASAKGIKYLVEKIKKENSNI